MNDEPGAAKGRPQSLGEEIANSMSHGLGLVAALVAAPVLIAEASRRGSTASVVGAAVFGATMILLYLASTIYHALPTNRAKRVFRVIDHAAIFLLIAGTYTPFTLGALRGPWGWTLFGLVWGMAVVGVTMKVVHGFHRPWLSTGLYLAMGWMVVIAVGPLFTHVPAAGILWLAAGGLSYTAGVAFYVAEGLPFAHFVWHLFVLGGTTCHFFAVLGYSG